MTDTSNTTYEQAPWPMLRRVPDLQFALKNAQDAAIAANDRVARHLQTIAKLEKQIAAAMRENAELRELLAQTQHNLSVLTKTIIAS